jgi:hypothetical protein
MGDKLIQLQATPGARDDATRLSLLLGVRRPVAVAAALQHFLTLSYAEQRAALARYYMKGHHSGH